MCIFVHTGLFLKKQRTIQSWYTISEWHMKHTRNHQNDNIVILGYMWYIWDKADADIADADIADADIADAGIRAIVSCSKREGWYEYLLYAFYQRYTISE
ncbi:MAG: hypothetical protein JXA33_28765 [Anaerolineae bacterium]|nr:hypothetical protein [Anaerolineae bacterium]